MVRVRRIQANEWAALRDLRLRALADAPHAFSTTLADAEQRSEADWRELARRGSSGHAWATFVADDGGSLVGMATGAVPDEPSPPRGALGPVNLMQMWVAPEMRRTGVGTRLVEAVLAWAVGRGSPRARLGVNAGDVGVVAFYKRCGFRDTGRRGSDLADRDAVAMEMECATGQFQHEPRARA
jgi:GNAT superfamily N-acetyltransferase